MIDSILQAQGLGLGGQFLCPPPGLSLAIPLKGRGIGGRGGEGGRGERGRRRREEDEDKKEEEEEEDGEEGEEGRRRMRRRGRKRERGTRGGRGTPLWGLSGAGLTMRFVCTLAFRLLCWAIQVLCCSYDPVSLLPHSLGPWGTWMGAPCWGWVAGALPGYGLSWNCESLWALPYCPYRGLEVLCSASKSSINTQEYLLPF